MRLESEEENIRDISPSQVRIPSALKAKIKAAAKANRHSMNAEIVGRLEASFPAEQEIVISDFPSGMKDDLTRAVENLAELLKQMKK